MGLDPNGAPSRTSGLKTPELLMDGTMGCWVPPASPIEAIGDAAVGPAKAKGDLGTLWTSMGAAQHLWAEIPLRTPRAAHGWERGSAGCLLLTLQGL